MSGDFALAARAALLAALRGDVALAGLAGPIDDSASGRGAVPQLSLAAVTALPWGAKDRAGAELRLTLVLRDRDSDEARAGAVGERICALMTALPRQFAAVDGGTWESGGWDVLRHDQRRLRDGTRESGWQWRLRGWPAA